MRIQLMLRQMAYFYVFISNLSNDRAWLGHSWKCCLWKCKFNRFCIFSLWPLTFRMYCCWWQEMYLCWQVAENIFPHCTGNISQLFQCQHVTYYLHCQVISVKDFDREYLRPVHWVNSLCSCPENLGNLLPPVLIIVHPERAVAKKARKPWSYASSELRRWPTRV